MPRRLVLVLAVIVSAGCGEPAPKESPAAALAAENAHAIAELRESIDSLRNEMRQQDRQLAGLGRDAASARSHAREDAPLAGGDADPADPARGATETAAVGEGDTADESAVRGMLESAAGRAAIEKAAAREVARREAEERRTFVSYTVGMFARRAGLDDHETGELQRIWKESLDAGDELRKRFAAVGRLPETERPAAREKAMEFMRGIGRERNEQVQALLTEEEYELYGETEEEILTAVHGGSRRPASRRPPGRPGGE